LRYAAHVSLKKEAGYEYNYGILVTKPLEERILREPIRIWEDNIYKKQVYNQQIAYIKNTTHSYMLRQLFFAIFREYQY
jgi:hypothetical protein